MKRINVEKAIRMLRGQVTGVVAENMARLGTFVADEIEAFVNSQPLNFEVTREQLATIG